MIMKKVILVLLLFLGISKIQAQQDVVIKHHLFIPQYNVGAVKALLFDYFGDNFHFQGKRKVWRAKEESYTYLVSTRNQKLRIYFKGYHDEMLEKVQAFYKDVLKLSDY